MRNKDMTYLTLFIEKYTENDTSSSKSGYSLPKGILENILAALEPKRTVPVNGHSRACAEFFVKRHVDAQLNSCSTIQCPPH